MPEIEDRALPAYLWLLRLVLSSLRAVTVSGKSMRILGSPSPTTMVTKSSEIFVTEKWLIIAVALAVLYAGIMRSLTRAKGRPVFLVTLHTFTPSWI
jgi:hypothetical protein